MNRIDMTAGNYYKDFAMKERMNLINDFHKMATELGYPYKKESKLKVANYRPISLLSNFYKIFASILVQRIQKVIEPYLQPTQFGFRKNKSTDKSS